MLDRDIRVGHRLRSVELTTSPVRLLRVVGRKVSWRAQSLTFERISRTLSSLVSQSNSQLSAAGWHVNPQTGLQRQTNLTAAERVLSHEYGEAVAHYQQLLEQFKRPDDGDDATGSQKVEAELLAACHFLQTGARELGFEARALDDLRDFVTEQDHVFRVDPMRPSMLTMIPRGKGPEVVFVDITVGRQTVTFRAPLALIGKDGGLVEVTLPVVKLHRR